MASDQISIPTLLIFLGVVSFIIYKVFFAPSTLNSRSVTGTNGSESPVLARQQEQACAHLLQMFPQLDRRTVLWNLRRNNNSVQVTSDMILAGRVAQPPPSFQPTPVSDIETPVTPKVAEEVKPDLITRYELQDKVSVQEFEEAQASGAAKGKAWSSNKEDRQALLKKRREDMILQARRKMEAKLAAQGAAKGSESCY